MGMWGEGVHFYGDDQPYQPVGPGEIEGIEVLQREHNAWLRTASRQQRAAQAREDLRRMPGQLYLFGGEEPDA